MAFTGLIILGLANPETTSADGGKKKTIRSVFTLRDLEVRHRNSERFREPGFGCGHGRAGSLVLTARALRNKNGKTDIEVSTGTLDSTTPPPGRIVEVRIKLLHKRFEHRMVKEFEHLDGGGYFHASLGGLFRGQQLEITVAAKGIDGRRTDVATIQEEIKLRPDLTVLGLVAPPQAKQFAPVNIAASVKELNGDAGARSDCVLLVDGTEVDRAHDIWVDAAGWVTCQFTQAFATTGTKQLQVKLDKVTPDDFDPTNNSVSGSIEIVSPIQPLAFTAGMTDYNYSLHTKNEGFVHPMNGTLDTNWDYKHEVTKTGWTQLSFFRGTSDRPLAFPLTSASVTEVNDGNEVYTKVYENLAAADPVTELDPDFTDVRRCALRTDETLHSRFFVCNHEYTYAAGNVVRSSSVEYSRAAGEVTYFSKGFDHYWSLTTGQDDVFSYNPANPPESYGIRPVLGSTYGYKIAITDAGNAQYSATPSIDLGPLSESVINPAVCTDTANPGGGSSRDCASSEYTATGKTGQVTSALP